jgi:hypothetical protein
LLLADPSAVGKQLQPAAFRTWEAKGGKKRIRKRINIKG